MRRLSTLLLLVCCSFGLFAQIVTIGTGTVQNTNQAYPAPYGNYYYGARHQMLIPASELTAAGAYAGNIWSVGFDVVTPSGVNNLGWTIKIGSTTQAALSAWETGLTTVHTSTGYTDVTGWNTHMFSTPFSWDGLSNIVIETCFNNTGFVLNAVMNQTTTAYNSTVYYREDAAAVCSNTSITGTAAQRPNLRFYFQPVQSLNIGMVNISSPGLSSTQGTKPVTGTLFNYGTATVTNATIGWSVDGVTQTPFSWTGSLGSGAEASVTVGNYNFIAGQHTIKLWSSGPNGGVDANPANDTTQATMNFAAGMSGTFSIGGSGADYATVAAAVADLNATGLMGPVIFNVTPGTGPYVGGFEFGNIPGASATNTVTFNGNYTTINESTATYIVGFNGSQYITLDSFNIAVTSASVNKFGILIRGASQYISLTNNVINMGITTTSTSSGGIVVSNSTTSATTTGNNGKYLTISNNKIIGGYYGMTIFGTASYLNCFGNLISNNILEDFYTYGIYLSNNDTTTVIGNNLSRPNRANISTLYGIYATTSRNIKYISNKIHNTGAGSYGAYPFYITTSLNTQGYETELINNAVYNIPSTSTIYGFYILGTNAFINLYYNTVHLTTVAGTNTVRGFFFSTAPTSYRLMNNNVSIAGIGTGTKYCIYVSTTAATMVSDFNNWYMGAAGTANYMGYWSANRNTLVDWQTITVQDGQSKSVNPNFPAFNDFHISSIDLYQAGTPIIGITTDIDGDPRNPSTPCIGADEYILFSNDAGAKGMVEPMATCAGPSTVKISIQNFGIVNLTGVTVNWSVNNIVQTPVTYSNMMVPGKVDTITLGTYTFANSTVYNFKFWTSNPNSVADQNPVNDTLYRNNFKTALTGTYTIGASPANFLTIADAVAELNANGVCGPVTFNVLAASGPYTGGITFQNILGTSAINTITFNGNNNVINESTSPVVVGFNNVSWITFTGFRIIVANPTANSRFGIYITGGSQRLTITNNFIDVGITNTSTASGGIVASGSQTSATTAGNNGRFLTISNNEILGGYYGITLNGNASYLDCNSNVVTNNIIRDFYVYATYFNNLDTFTFTGNNIHRMNRTTISTFYGAYFATSRNVKILNNRIHSGGSGAYTMYGIYFSTSVNTQGFESEVINNAVYNMNTTSTIYGLYLAGTRNYMKIYHNTFHFNLPSGNTGTIYVVYQSSAPDNTDMKNNIFALEGLGSGTKYLHYVGTASTTFQSDYNNYFIGTYGGTNNFGYWTTAANADLTAWRTASTQDLNSIFANPVLTNPLAGNILPQSGTINNMGTPVGVLTDLNNVTRNASTPDVGALEFTGIAADIAIAPGGYLANAQCLNTNDSVYLKIVNTVGSTINFATATTTVYWNVTGPVNSNGSIVINTGTLAINNTLTVGSSGVNMSKPGTYTLHAYVGANSVNLVQSNDTLNNMATKIIYNPFSVQPGTTYVGSTTATVPISALSTFFPAGAFFFTEVCQFRGATTGNPSGGWPSYMIADDYIEITGVPNTDLGGHTLEQWNTTALAGTYTFPPGTFLSPAGTAIIAVGEMGSSVPSPANFYYHGNGTYSSSWGSTTACGRILKDGSGNIVDAVGYYGFSFPAAANVPSNMWSASNTGGSSTAGIRLTGPDNNTGSNWVVSSATVPQNPNALNAGVPLPPPASVTGFTWSHNGVVFATNVIDTTVGPWTNPGTYNYIASYVTPCGTLTDTVKVNVLLASVTGTTQICAGDSAMISITLSGTGPWTMIGSDGSGNDTFNVPTSPWVMYVNPTTTTTYTVVKFADAGNVFVNSGAAITVNVTPAPVVALSSFAPLCSNAAPLALTGGTPTGGTYSGPGVTGTTFNPATAGVGLHTITYSYQDPVSLCTGSDSKQIEVLSGPTIAVTPNLDICPGTPTTLEVTLPGVSPTSVFFSEYIEGSSNNKAIEIFNGTPDTVLLANYRIGQSTNGGGWSYWHTFPAGAKLAPHATWVMVTNQVSAAYYDTTFADEVLAFPSVVHHNGDDARSVEVTADGGLTWTIIDIIGEPSNDPGTAWPVAGVNNATAEKTLIRKPHITHGDTSWTNVAGVDSLTSQYLVHPQNYFANLGSHAYNAPPVMNLAYFWSNGATTSSITVSPTVATTYTVTVIDVVTNCSAIGTVVVGMKPAATVNLGPDFDVCSDKTAVIDAGTGFTSYMWSTGATTQSIVVDGAVIGLNNTATYTVTVTNSAGCEGIDAVAVTSIDCTGIDDPDNASHLTFWPNPTDGHFFLKINGLKGDAMLTILNAAGQVVAIENLTLSGEMVKEFHLNNMAPGIYMVRLQTKSDVVTKQIIVK